MVVDGQLLHCSPDLWQGTSDQDPWCWARYYSALQCGHCQVDPDGASRRFPDSCVVSPTEGSRILCQWMMWLPSSGWRLIHRHQMHCVYIHSMENPLLSHHQLRVFTSMCWHPSQTSQHSGPIYSMLTTQVDMHSLKPCQIVLISTHVGISISHVLPGTFRILLCDLLVMSWWTRSLPVCQIVPLLRQTSFVLMMCGVQIWEV